jgi:hypothetical protein
VCPAQRRGAEDELEPVGQEDGDERAGARADQRLDRGTVRPQALGLAGLEADRHLVAAEPVLAEELGAGELGTEADDLTLVRGPARARRAGEVDRLQQVRLAGAVAAGDDGQARAQPDVRALVGAEVTEGQGADEHVSVAKDGDGLDPRAGRTQARATHSA